MNLTDQAVQFKSQLKSFEGLVLSGLRDARAKIHKRVTTERILREFASDLMLCPTEQAAQSRMLADILTARDFLLIAGALGTELDRGHVRFEFAMPQETTPFFVLGYLMWVDLLEKEKKKLADEQ